MPLTLDYTLSTPPSKHDNAVLDVLSDIIVNGVESGYIGYWADVTGYQWADRDLKPNGRLVLPEGRRTDAFALVSDREGEGVASPVTPEGLLGVVVKIANGTINADSGTYGEPLPDRLTAMLRDPREDDFDAADADIIFQVAMFGDVIYG